MAAYYAIIDEADPKHVKELALMVGVSVGTAGGEKVAEHYGLHAAERGLPWIEAFDILHGLEKNIEIELEVQKQIEALKKKLRCK